MNDIQIFNNKEFFKLREIEKNTSDYFGFVYILEYGNLLKIGKTKNIYQRITALAHQGTKYSDMAIGSVAILPKCTNYGDIEKKAHNLLREYRKEGTELFNIGFRDAITIISEGNFEFKDESKQFSERANSFLNGMKNFIGGKTDKIVFR